MKVEKMDERLHELQDREIPPSGASWGKLEQMLDEANEKNKLIWWRAIAVVLLLGGCLVGWQTDFSTGEKPTQQIVFDEVIENNASEVETSPKIVPQEENAIVKNHIERKETRKGHFLLNQVDKAAQIMPPKKKKPQQEADILLVEINTETTGDKRKNTQKQADVMVQELLVKNDLEIVTDEEIEMLLQQAREKIHTQKLFATNTSEVDPQVLLQQVEATIEEPPFQEKLFNAVKKQLIRLAATSHIIH